NFPTATPVQATNAGLGDAFVTKLNAAGTSLLYSTYLGGSGDEGGNGIAVDAAGQAYATGSTSSTNFPTTNPFQATNAGLGDVFVTKLHSAGTSLLYSTYLGGTGGDGGTGIAVDGAGQAYVTGTTSSTNFPTVTPSQATLTGGGEAFVTKLNAAGALLLYSTYLGGSDADQGSGIAVDGAGVAYVTGYTDSTNFPTVTPLQVTNGGYRDVFVTKISASVTNRLPVCSAAQANPASLWTPDGQVVSIVVTGVTDADGD
ncbi:MAG: SBBP repeat-containing protein, partial [Nitrospirales bacterium]